MLYFLQRALKLLNPSRSLAVLFSSVRVPWGLDWVFAGVSKREDFLNPDQQRIDSLRVLKNLGEHGKLAAKNPDATSMSIHTFRMA